MDEEPGKGVTVMAALEFFRRLHSATEDIDWTRKFNNLKLNAQLETVNTTEQNCNNYYGRKESSFGASEERIN